MASKMVKPGNRRLRALLWGHSFLKRLMYLCRKKNKCAINFALEEYCWIEWMGQGGLRFSDIESSFATVIKSHKPDIVFLDCFGNDLDGGWIRLT